MPLFYDSAQPNILSDILCCVSGDPGLGVAKYHFKDELNIVTYLPTKFDFAAGRMNAIINNFPNYFVIVYGLHSDQKVLSDTRYYPISNFGGITYPPTEEGIIYIAYDIDEGAKGAESPYSVDASPNLVPPYIKLFHELAHAFHHENGDFDIYNYERQAIDEENHLRVLHGFPSRHPWFFNREVESSKSSVKSGILTARL